MPGFVMNTSTVPCRPTDSYRATSRPWIVIGVLTTRLKKTFGLGQPVQRYWLPVGVSVDSGDWAPAIGGSARARMSGSFFMGPRSRLSWEGGVRQRTPGD